MDQIENSLFHESLVTTNRVLYTPSNFARQNLLHLQEVGSLQATKPHTSHRDHLDSFLFFIVRSGSGSLQYQSHHYALHTGDCVFINCNTAYSHTTSYDLWELKWAHFSGDSMPGIYGKYLDRGGSPVFHPSDLNPYESALDDLYTLAEADDYIRDMHVNEKLSHLLSLLMEQSWNPERSSITSLNAAAKIKQLIDMNYKKKVSLAELARETGYNKYYIIRMFKEQYGTTIGTYVQQLRVSKAKQLLRFSELSVEDIGLQTGFSDANYFSRVFRKIEGVSPATYRKSW